MNQINVGRPMFVHDLLESQNSRLEIDSTPGKGSRFSFRLPLWHEQHAALE